MWPLLQPWERRPGRKSARRDWTGTVSAVALCSMLLGSQLSLAPATAGKSPAAPGTVPLNQSLVLRAYYFQNYAVDSFSGNTTVQYAASSTDSRGSPISISVALMTAVQYYDFENNSSDPISNSLTYDNGSSIQGGCSIPAGQYYLVFYAYAGRSYIQFGYEVSPNTPYSYGGVPSPLAMGLASFGVYNESGTAIPYRIQTRELVGVANISSVQVNTQDAFRYGVSPSGFSVQLNAMLVVGDGGASSPQVFWVHNVPDFETGPSIVSFGDQIWNQTDGAGYLSNQTITSVNGGFVFTTGQTRLSAGMSYYSNAMGNATYSLPFRFGLVMNATLVPGTGVSVRFGYRLLANGSAASSPPVWFDSVTIHDQAARSAYFEVSGSDTPPTGLYYDAELVFAGEGNLESAYFTQLGAALGLFYLNGDALNSFPSYYGFSGDTGEAAANLVEAYSNGIVRLTPGASPAYVYLGNASLSLDPNSLLVTRSSVTPTGTRSSTLTTGGTTGAQPSPPTEEYILAGVVVVVVVLAVVAALYRLRPATPPGYQESGAPDQGGPPPPPPSPEPAPAGTA